MRAERARVSIVGGSGYAGGELLRLLLDHPRIEVAQVTSERLAGKPVHTAHPNLRGRSQLAFVPAAQLEQVDALCLALPHGSAQKRMAELAPKAERLVDLSADFRLRDLDRYRRWYGEDHAAPEWVPRFVYGLPELHREQLRGARYASGVGCNATASILALLPLVKAGLLDPARPVVVDLKVGSSEGGAEATPASHHPERSGVIRTYMPTGHRHTGEVEQELGLSDVHLTITSIEAVRGVLATAHCWAARPLEPKELWRAYRAATAEQPFLRIVKDAGGIHRYPEPKVLSGSNYADLGFELSADGRRVVALCALDNLMKGAAGTALQCLNLMLGFEETLGLSFPGLHPL